MSSFAFVILFFGLFFGLYLYVTKKWEKRQHEVSDFAFEMQKEFSQDTNTLTKAVDFYNVVINHYEKEKYTISKHPDFPTDFIAKKDKDILFIRVQNPNDNADITARVLQGFVGQTVIPALNNALYSSYNLKWAFVCSKMMCDQSAKIFIKNSQDRVKFELIEVS